jgi:ribosomal protein L11 methyltransferase
MGFLGLHIKCDAIKTELLMAELSMLPFDTFQEQEDGLSCFADEDAVEPASFQAILEKYGIGQDHFAVESIPKQNWNETWEQAYEPVVVEDQLRIRASFHESESSKYPLEIIITPKMSFGTGHHATTYLMSKLQMTLEHQKKFVYDLGTGTGILAILAKKLGASNVIATDVDDWSIENSIENFRLNAVEEIEIYQGAVAELNLVKQADIILANINKNILLQELSYYGNLLRPEGFLLLSGFYQKDLADISKQALSFQLIFEQAETKNDWVAALFKKQK